MRSAVGPQLASVRTSCSVIFFPSTFRRTDSSTTRMLTGSRETGPMPAYGVSGHMTWNIKRPWSAMLPNTRFMAMTEALAHLRLLAERHDIREITGERTLYELAA